jgi:Rho-binding antiterminator
MSKTTNKYQSISCSYYDQIEAYATKRTRCSILYQDGSEKTADGIIVDIYSKESAEYLKVDDGTVIRLDHIISINDIPVPKHC